MQSEYDANKIFEKYNLKFEIEANCPGIRGQSEFFLITFLYLPGEEINEPTVKFPFSNRIIFGIKSTTRTTTGQQL